MMSNDEKSFCGMVLVDIPNRLELWGACLISLPRQKGWLVRKGSEAVSALPSERVVSGQPAPLVTVSRLSCSVCGLPVHCAAHAAAADLLDRACPRAHQHHGVHQHLLPAGELHCAFHQGHWAGGPRHLAQQPIQSEGPLPVPCAPGCPGLQHHRPVQVHQQGPGVLRLLCVRGHLLCRVYHAGPAGFSHPLPGVEQCGPGGLLGHGLWIYNCLRGNCPYTSVQRIQFQPWGDEQIQYENRLRCSHGLGV